MTGELRVPTTLAMIERTSLRGIARSVVAAAFVVWAGSATSAGAQVLEVRDVVAIAEFADRTQLDLSPSGDRVAFTLVDPLRSVEARSGGAYFDQRGVPRAHIGSDVYVADATTGATRRLSDGHGSSWGPVWSPDGRYLAFYSDTGGYARVWLWDVTNDRVVRLSDEIVRPFWGFEALQWSPEGRRLLVKLVPQGSSLSDLERLLPIRSATPEPMPDPVGVTVRLFAYRPEDYRQTEEQPAAGVVDLDSTRSFLNVQLGDLALVDVPSGRVRRIARRVRAIGYRFSPAGDRVAFTTRQPDGGTGMLVYDRYDLWVVDVAGGPARLLAPKTVQEYGLGFSWSPSGERIASFSDGAVHVLRAEDGGALATFAPDGLTLESAYRPPLWLDEESMAVVARDTVWRLSSKTGRVEPIGSPQELRVGGVVAPAGAQRLSGSHVLLAVADPVSKRSGFQRLDIKSGRSEPLYEADVALGATGMAYDLDMSRDGGLVVFVSQSASSPPDVWISDSGFTRPRRLTDLHRGVSGHALGRSQLVEWTDSGGRPLRGALLLPPDHKPGDRHPLVVKVYGGSRLSGTVNQFGLESGIDNLQLLATRGYAVLLPDAPLREGMPMADLASSVLPGLDAVIEMGVVDPERVALLGHSYGGYSVLALAVQSPHFRAVISSGGFSNLLSQYTEMREDGSVVGIGWSENGQGRMGGHPWDHPTRYRDNSPFFFLDQLTAPVLLLHGGSDRTVLAQRAQETFVGLRRLGKEVTLAVYDGEGHHPGSWSLANATDYWERIFDWLDRQLLPVPPRP